MQQILKICINFPEGKKIKPKQNGTVPLFFPYKILLNTKGNGRGSYKRLLFLAQRDMVMLAMFDTMFEMFEHV